MDSPAASPKNAFPGDSWSRHSICAASIEFGMIAYALIHDADLRYRLETILKADLPQRDLRLLALQARVSTDRQPFSQIEEAA